MSAFAQRIPGRTGWVSCMSERADLIDGFLLRHGWADWTRVPLKNDASARRYERLTSGHKSLILMDADPAGNDDTRPFARVATFLAEEGLCPPDILAHDPAAGLMVLSDLGPKSVAAWVQDVPADESLLYRAATDVLVRLHQRQPKFALPRLTPDVGGDMVAILYPFYTDDAVDDLVAETSRALSQLAPEADTVALRDYHAENLIWRSAQTGTNRVGLLDFQDALMAPAGYDLASLLRDVRRDVSPRVVDEMTTYFMAQTGLDASFPAQLACLGAQRNLRILAVFARLAKQHGKPHYVDLIPRVWRNLMQDLAHPALRDLKQAVEEVLPPPDADLLRRLRQ